jgi:hypothetical protein
MCAGLKPRSLTQVKLIRSALDLARTSSNDRFMGFNRRKLEAELRLAAERKAAEQRATNAQVLEDAERLIAAWNERQAKRMPMLFSPTIGVLSPRAFGFFGSDARLAEPSTR